ncbi:hypothetical protein EON83_06455 [bacterium]|nr:MAG: hypothetical protein EON83_06455 [bacterium]
MATIVNAAPVRKKVTWEYATLDLSATRQISQNPVKYEYGAELFLPGGKVVFLKSEQPNTSKYNTFLLNRLGAQGWELAAVPAGGQEYIFKREK